MEDKSLCAFTSQKKTKKNTWVTISIPRADEALSSPQTSGLLATPASLKAPEIL